MPEHITSNKGSGSLAGRRTGLISGFSFMLTLLVVAPAVAQVPCPPQIFGTQGEACEAIPPQPAQQSNTPDYQDPLTACSGLQARRVVSVATATALQDAMTNANCGDTIRLASGTYASTFSISKSCPATNPIIVEGAANFQSTISSRLTITGQRTIITGIKFSGQNARVFLGGTNNKLLANKFTDWRSRAVIPTTGEQGEIAYNEFYEPHPWLQSEVGTYPLRIGIRTNEKGASNFHFRAWVHDNYFHDFPAKPDPSVYSSGQSDAIELCETNREWTYSTPSGWYIERNLIENHQQGHGIIDLKCGGAVVRYNTVIDSPGGRIDIRAGAGSTLESNWLEGSGGSTVHGGDHRVVGNYMRGGGGIELISGDQPWNTGVSGGHNQAYRVLVTGNDTNSLIVGKTYYGAMEAYPTTGTVIEGHKGSDPLLHSEQETTVRSSTTALFAAASKLGSGDVGPSALSQASPAYLQCRRP
jgi:hypothetical protein